MPPMHPLSTLFRLFRLAVSSPLMGGLLLLGGCAGLAPDMGQSDAIPQAPPALAVGEPAAAATRPPRATRPTALSKPMARGAVGARGPAGLRTAAITAAPPPAPSAARPTAPPVQPPAVVVAVPAPAPPVRRLLSPLPAALMHAPGARQREGDGLSIAAPHGARISAAAAGTVAFAGLVAKRGNTVLIRHTGGLFTVYCHLDAIAVPPGAEVKAGAFIGTVGVTGGIQSPRLYLEVRKERTPVDPIPYF